MTCFFNLYPASVLQPSGQAAFPGEASCSYAWDYLCGKATKRVVVFPCKNLPPSQTMLLFCYFITWPCCILFIIWNIFVLQYVLLHAHGSKIYLLADQILLSSSFNAYGSWNIRHQIRAVSNSAEWMVLLLQGLTYHCHKRSKTI